MQILDCVVALLKDMLTVPPHVSHQRAAADNAVPAVNPGQQRPQLLNRALQGAKRVEGAVGIERRRQVQGGGAPEVQRFHRVQ